MRFLLVVQREHALKLGMHGGNASDKPSHSDEEVVREPRSDREESADPYRGGAFILHILAVAWIIHVLRSYSITSTSVGGCIALFGVATAVVGFEGHYDALKPWFQ
ncbi:MAG: hypothetical protein ACP5XB_14195 [Isosphaeraceae bacterium]